MLQRTAIAALGLVCVLGEVRAECPQNVLPGALSARVDARGLELMKGVLLEQLPSSIDVPETPQVLMDCPAGFDDTVSYAARRRDRSRTALTRRPHGATAPSRWTSPSTSAPRWISR